MCKENGTALDWEWKEMYCTGVPIQKSKMITVFLQNRVWRHLLRCPSKGRKSRH